MAAIALLAPFIPTEIEVLAYIAWETLTEGIRERKKKKKTRYGLQQWKH